MALAASLAQLHAEASCPICLDCLKDPVTTGCGHNFCHACLQQRWEGLRDLFPCPLCLQPCPERSCRRNSQLSHLADAVRQLPSTRAKRGRQGEAPLCEQHSQALSLFCQEDLELLCPQCRLSSKHRHHPLVPVEQAAVCHRRRLKGYLEPLTKQLEDAGKGLEMQVSKSFELVSNVENRKSELLFEAEHFKNFLKTEHNVIDFMLQTEEKSVQYEIIDKKTQISDHGSTLKTLFYEITNKCSQSDLELLTGTESIHRSYENLESPAAISYEVKKEVFTLPPQYFGLHRMISTFQVHLTLEPKTAHQSLRISQDQKTATFQRWNQTVFILPKCLPLTPLS
ncbi:tripartite motif-containing protein 60-like [Vicugna pacos]|uniref:Tripartite motif-containing protein 60-like n=1 Tax=Vicugna pacos TaxID=30538 RepID=A0A6J0B260_VICPA